MAHKIRMPLLCRQEAGKASQNHEQKTYEHGFPFEAVAGDRKDSSYERTDNTGSMRQAPTPGQPGQESPLRGGRGDGKQADGPPGCMAHAEEQNQPADKVGICRSYVGSWPRRQRRKRIAEASG